MILEGSFVIILEPFQNLAMLVAVGSHTFAASKNADPVIAIFSLGILVFMATFLVSFHLQDNQSKAPVE